MMMDGGMMGALTLLWVIFVLVLIALAVAALVWIVRSLKRPSEPASQPAGAARDGTGPALCGG